MANTKSAAKRARQSARRHARNTSVINNLKTAQKKFRATAASGKVEDAVAGYNAVASSLDKAAKRGAIHRNVAARRKSRLAKALKPASA